MTQLKDFVDFVDLERQAQESEVLSRELLEERALEWLGYAITNLTISKIDKKLLIFTCPNNNSRFRQGDRLVITHPEGKIIKGSLVEVGRNGRRLVVLANASDSFVGKSGWTAVEDYADLSISTLTALRKIQAGAPGWTFAQRMIGNAELPEQSALMRNQHLLESLHQETGKVFDPSQENAYYKCLGMPPIIGVQGPPGTGKTMVLAYVAEALIRSKKRVVIIAPTHQAVNNALSTIKELFPNRIVKKYGDELRTESLSTNIPVITSPKDISKEPENTIVGFTYMSAIHQLMISDQKVLAPHALIIDEAGQLPATQGICAGLSGASSVMLFGDDKQMPPVFPGDLSEEPLAISTFALLRNSQSQSINMLNTTYRMNDGLCTAIGETFYADNGVSNLFPSDEARSRTFPKINNVRPDLFIDQVLNNTEPLTWITVPTRYKTQFNPEEAEIVARIVYSCLIGGIDTEQVAVVTPYRRQVMLIRNKLKELLGEDKELPIVDTVERVQGLTVEIVVMSLCSSEKEYIESNAEFLFSPNRMNVAISRAKTKAIVVSSPDVFDMTPKTIVGVNSRNTCNKLVRQFARIN